MIDPVHIAVFASGRGSNFRAIHELLAAMSEPPARIVLCVSNNPAPGAFEYARQEGIPALRSSPKMFSAAGEYETALLDLLAGHGVELIVLAGYMRKLPEKVVERYQGRILNIHPSLLPKFGGQGMYGSHVHEAVIAAGDQQSGATVHLVDADYDTGAIVAQERVDVLPGDTPETLGARVLQAEHRLYPRTVVEWARKLRTAREHEAAPTDGGE